MEKRSYKSLGDSISLLGFGLMRLPIIDGNAAKIDYELGKKMVDRAIECGVNYFDTAYIYHEGQSEKFAGAALSRHPRESYNLATKMPTWLVGSAEEAENFFNEQLKNCQVKYFDYYLVHNLNTDNYEILKKFHLYEMLKEKQKQGLIRHLGFSMHDSPEQLARVVNDYEWDFVQIQLNYLDWDSLKCKELYQILVDKKLPIIVMEPIRGGVLASLTPETLEILKKADPQASPASWALRYASSFPEVLTVLSGMSTPEQVEDNLKVTTDFKPITAQEQEILDQVAKSFRSAATIPCTSCRYCMDCPSGVDIPVNFAIYNRYRSFIDSNPSFAPIIFANDYRTLTLAERADQCTSCENCLSHCPQNIMIPKILGEISSFAAGLSA